MKIAAAASWLHKWLALIVGVQILFWIVSGLFFTLFPIAQVRSEHRMAESAAVLPLAALASPAELAALLPGPPQHLSYEIDATGRVVAIAEFAEHAPVLIDVAARRTLSPLSETDARAIASASVKAAPSVREARLVTAPGAEYRGALPAWRVAFNDSEGLAIYVASGTGRVTARRSDLWRIYDALWALHIMDWRDHENFNNGLMIAAALLALIVTIAGFVLLPYRLGVGRKPIR